MRGATAAGAAVPARAAATPPPPSPSLPSPWPPIDWTEPVLRATAVVWQCCVLPVLQAQTQAACPARREPGAFRSSDPCRRPPLPPPCTAGLRPRGAAGAYAYYVMAAQPTTRHSDEHGMGCSTAHRAAVGCGDDKSRRRPPPPRLSRLASCEASAWGGRAAVGHDSEQHHHRSLHSPRGCVVHPVGIAVPAQAYVQPVYLPVTRTLHLLIIKYTEWHLGCCSAEPRLPHGGGTVGCLLHPA